MVVPFKQTRHKNTKKKHSNFSKCVKYITVGFALRSQGFEIKWLSLVLHSSWSKTTNAQGLLDTG